MTNFAGGREKETEHKKRTEEIAIYFVSVAVVRVTFVHFNGVIRQPL